jgi:hypothetical protein
MGVHSGKFANVNGISTMRLWTIEERAAQPKAVASNTAQGTARKRGINSWSGSYQAYGVTPQVMPGDTLHFIGYGAPADDVSGNAGGRYEGDAVVSQVSLAWNWKSGALIGHSINFAGHLELDKTSDVDVPDVTLPQLFETTGTKITWALGTDNTFRELPNLVSAALRITNPVETYVNSSTYVNGRAWTGQKAGAGLDWNLSIQQEDDERLDNTKIWQVDDVLKLRVYTDANLFWGLTYGIARDFSGMSYNRETGAIIARTLNVDMNGYYVSGLGSIALPDATTWWPVP